MNTVESKARSTAQEAAEAVGGWEFDYDKRECVSSSGVVTVECRCPECGIDTREGVGSFKCRCEQDAYWRAYRQHWDQHGHEDVEHRWGMLKTIPARYKAARFDNFQSRRGTEAAVATCRKWSGSFVGRVSDGILLVGPFGSGKTHLAVASVYEAMKRSPVYPRFVSAATLSHDVKKGEQLDMEPVNQACSAQLLILDDLGQTGRTEFDREIIYRIVSERYEKQKPIVATSNLTEQKLADALGGALVSRLYECTRMAALTASDYRKESRGVTA